MARLFSCVPIGWSSPCRFLHTGTIKVLSIILTTQLIITELNMPSIDDDVIDISWMTEEELHEHLRHLSDLSSCPCVECCANCDRTEKVASCDAFQLWYAERMKNRRGA